MQNELCFNLITEPWLPVRLVNGEAADVGLRNALVRAHEIAGLDIEHPTQEPALLRLLLACCYRIFIGPADDSQWHELWEAPRLAEEAVDTYFEQWADRFDLFSQQAPFFQSPGLEPMGKDGVKAMNSLLAHAASGNNVPLFTPVTDATGIVMMPSEAARWLVERHAWGTASDKTGAKSNDRAKNGKDTPKVGHLAWIGFVAPIGGTLRDMLLLNLVPWQRSSLVRGGPNDLPSWERDPLGPSRTTRSPDGVCDLYTWQSRRIRLYPERKQGKVIVSKVLICAGDEVDRDAVRDVDPHVGWKSTKKKDGTLDYSPVRPHPGQQVWRGLSALLALDAGHQRAGVLSFLSGLETTGISMVSLLVTSAELGQMSTTLTDFVSDHLNTPLALLRAKDCEAATIASDAVTLAHDAGKALAHVAKVPYLTYNTETRGYSVQDGKTRSARKAQGALAEELYSTLDSPYRRFLVKLGEVANFDIARVSWATTVVTAARNLANRQMAQLSSAQAFVGAMAEANFRRKIAEARKTFSPDNDRKDGAA